MGDRKVDEAGGTDEIIHEGIFAGVCLPRAHAGALAEFSCVVEETVDVSLDFLDRAGQRDPTSQGVFNRLHVLQNAERNHFKVWLFQVAEEPPIRPDGVQVGVK